MTSVKDELLGVSLGGRYRLERWLGGDGDAAFFLTTAAEGRRAALKLIPDDPSTAEQQIARWRRTVTLSHPNLLPLLDFGRGDAGGRAFLFAVFEFPDDSLSGALARGGLSEEEAREVWNAVVEALRYIHSQGLVHGSVDAEHIVAVGSEIKLASDTLRAPTRDYSAADDFRALGRTGLRAAPPDPAPRETQNDARRPRFPKWSYAVIPALVLLAALAIWRPARPHPQPQPAPPPLKRVSAPRAPLAAAAAPLRPQPRGRVFWRVIAYTYNTRRGAEKKVETVNRKAPGLHPEVFTPAGKDRPPFLVALGGRMTKDEAVRLRKQARAKGLARDTFVRNYAE